MAKIKTVRTRKRGKTYSYSFDAGKHPQTGRRKVIEKGGFATEQEAFDAGTAAYIDWKSGNIGLTSERVKLKEYLVSWLENISRPQIKRMTYRNYCYSLHNNVIPYIGEIYLQELRPRDCANMVQKLVDRGLKKTTIRTAKNVLSLALKYAIYPAEIISSNAISNISIPRNADTTPQVKREIISPEQFQNIIHEESFGKKFYMPLMLAYHTGMRIGEVLGLEWSCVDFEKETIYVRQTLSTFGQSRHAYIDTPKTKTSVRSILIDEFLLSDLQQWKEQQEENKRTADRNYQLVYKDKDGFLYTASIALPLRDGDTLCDFICTDMRGRFIHYSAMNYFLRIRGLNAHSFRHTHATQLIENGAKPVAVAARLGHTDATITQNLYTHDTEAMQKETINIFQQSLVDKAFRRQNADK